MNNQLICLEQKKRSAPHGPSVAIASLSMSSQGSKGESSETQKDCYTESQLRDKFAHILFPLTKKQEALARDPKNDLRRISRVF